MDGITISQAAIWGIAALAAGGVIVRPWRFPEAIWAVLGAAALVLLALLHGMMRSLPSARGLTLTSF